MYEDFISIGACVLVIIRNSSLACVFQFSRSVFSVQYLSRSFILTVCASECFSSITPFFPDCPVTLFLIFISDLSCTSTLIYSFADNFIVHYFTLPDNYTSLQLLIASCDSAVACLISDLSFIPDFASETNFHHHSVLSIFQITIPSSLVTHNLVLSHLSSSLSIFVLFYSFLERPYY